MRAPHALLLSALLLAGCLEEPAGAEDESRAGGGAGMGGEAALPGAANATNATPSAPTVAPSPEPTPAPPSRAPPAEATWQGMDNELGSLRAPYELTASVDGRAPIVAHVTLRQHYDEEEARFFLFSWNAENTPIDLTFDGLQRADTGDELPCYQREASSNASLKCFVDARDLPPEGTQIAMRGTAGSARAGVFQVGALVVPFTHRWERVAMSNGLDAELYGASTIRFDEAPGGEGSAPPAPPAPSPTPEP